MTRHLSELRDNIVSDRLAIAPYGAGASGSLGNHSITLARVAITLFAARQLTGSLLAPCAISKIN